MSYEHLTPIQIDALREVGNIGAGNAATALSQLLNKKIDMSVPAINVVPFDQIFSGIGGEEIVYGVLVRVLGDTPGNILFIFEKEIAINIIEVLTGMKEETVSEMGYSVISEIGNIISASYMNAIAKFTNLTIIPSVPAVAYDMLGAILSTSFIESGQFDEYVLDVETAFLQDNSEISGHFYYIPMPGSLEIILNSLGVM
ncbi:chemotaxis protein CheC [Clostridium tetanomorphum]|uniref:Chemotaxis protein CheC n=1 Tax=Clostridium tetanomorphum TaxID=1553 RepID=A0A923EB19_CLOTT|nr:chemotaxis protein CheC [Clostridium tetanomorphum]KAJ53491.1 chemotaxis protein CheC [Clostridium tetanomorphum DSM 665]MBC2398434.1 chemotaxis protein CheC [Clostridium tetanomorphum]MBP1865276.1 chemotaxis protein CheC [Clostridium tetanomorphum]NRS85199.1 chemotaxis protein CheC [Clostridium tetanomorphum]NRZ98378.1 chemotaxis protein CheC [Clostridium tetanomorphum]